MKTFFSVLIFFILSNFLTYSQDADYIKISSDVRYQYLGTYDVPLLNDILTKEVPQAVGGKVSFTPAKNAVKLYKVEYNSVIPEQNNRPTLASGLIAIPDTGLKSMPMISYQHGTLYADMGVSSQPDKCFEMRLMIAQFAAQGYIVIGADYFGLGSSKEKDSYMVLNSHVQSCYDMYDAAKAILEKEAITINNFFVTGWSQGGVVSMALLERLETLRIPVQAMGTAAAQCDGFVMANGFLSHPRKIDAEWVTMVFILTAFSFEEYYQIPGLARGVFTEEFYDVAKRVYNKDLTLEVKDYPTDLRKLIRSEYFDSNYFKQSAYGKLLLEMHPYRWDIKTPVKMCYGDSDECLSIGLARLPMEWQKAIGNNTTEAISMGPDATHRITYARAAVVWKKWFDSLTQ
jgi:pimeloyl-ACP methyl ester carboxylesterase